MQSRRSASDFFQRKMREQKRSGTGDAERPGGIPTQSVGTRKGKLNSGDSRSHAPRGNAEPTLRVGFFPA
ncbi:MAG: hypothetical protein BWK80_60800, partial [Desulfobacteraceae bacterium IS3]